jgi:hypothetical protein
MDEREQQRKVRHRLAVLRHAEEVTGRGWRSGWWRRRHPSATCGSACVVQRLNTPANPPACQSACQSTLASRRPHALSPAGCHAVSAVVSASGRSSQHLAKVRVAGSNPVVRSTKHQVMGL